MLNRYGNYDQMVVYVDANWARCIRIRKSTNKGMITLGNTCLKAWSPTQRTVPLSSGGSQLYALVKGAAEGIGVKN